MFTKRSQEQGPTVSDSPTVRQSDSPTAADSVRQCPTVNSPLTHTTRASLTATPPGTYVDRERAGVVEERFGDG